MFTLSQVPSEMIIKVHIPAISASGLTRKINVTIKTPKTKKEDSWLSNELSNMMERSLLCYIKAYGTTTEYCISFFKTILDSGKDWEKEWIAVNERFNERRESKLN